MKYYIKAISIENAWAYIELNNKIWLFRPPFTNLETSDFDEMKKAIELFEFEKRNISYDNLNAVIDFIKSAYVNFKNNEDNKFHGSISNYEILKTAPKSVINKFLNRIENELITQNEFEHAQNILTDILMLPILDNNEDLNKKAKELNKIVSEKLKFRGLFNNGAISQLFSKYILFYKNVINPINNPPKAA